MLEKPYRPCVGIALFNRNGLVFIGRRFGGVEHHDAQHQWQMPQGGIDDGEEPRFAAARELFEETNISTVRYLGELHEWLSYDLPEDLAGRAWRGKYRGQTQKWFAYRFEGDEQEIDVRNPGDGHYKAEFKEWRWERLGDVPHLVIPFKKPIYERVAEEFMPFTQISG